MDEYMRVAKTADVPPGGVKRVEVQGEPVALFNVDGEFFAIEDTCSHAEASLSDGWFEEDVVECPLHGARFCVRTGRNLTLPATEPVARYQVRVDGEDILVSGR